MKTIRHLASAMGIAALSAGIIVGTTSTSSTAYAGADTDGFSIQGSSDTIIELDGTPYKVSVSNGTAAVGSPATIKVTVTATDGFKCNGSYKHKVKKISAPSEVDMAADVFPGSISGKSIHYAVVGTPKAKGSWKISGQIRFSVCSSESCHVKKLPLDATITGT